MTDTAGQTGAPSHGVSPQRSHGGAWVFVVLGVILALGSLELLVLSACSDSPTQLQTPLAAKPSASATTAQTPSATAQGQSWGLFMVVGPDAAPISVMLDFGQGAVATGTLSGPDAAIQAAKAASRFADLPPGVYATLRPLGFQVQGASAEQEASGAFHSWLLLGREAPKPAMLELSAYTPTGPVQVFRYPNSPVHLTEASMLVNNHPTITKFPDPTMADPYADRSVMWSQDGAVYVLHGYGPFTSDDLIRWARAISAARR